MYEIPEMNKFNFYECLQENVDRKRVDAGRAGAVGASGPLRHDGDRVEHCREHSR